MLNQGLIQDFQKLLGPEQVLVSEADRLTYAYDAAVLEPVLPALVVRPRSAEALGRVVALEVVQEFQGGRHDAGGDARRRLKPAATDRLEEAGRLLPASPKQDGDFFVEG